MNWDWLVRAFTPRRSTLPTRPPMKKRDNNGLGETSDSGKAQVGDAQAHPTDSRKTQITISNEKEKDSESFMTDEEFREIVRRGERVYII